MTRVKSKAQISHRKIRKLAKGYRNARSRRFKTANEAVMHAGAYAFRGRKLRKRNLKSLWILRLNAAVAEYGLSYSKFISLLKSAKVVINRKFLAEIARTDKNGFSKIVEFVKK